MSKYRYHAPLAHSYLDLDWIQSEIREWQDRNFPMSKDEELHPFLGMIEEMGEAALPLLAMYFIGKMAHAKLKMEQGIRGTREEHEAKIKDAIGDFAVFLMSFCDHEGWKLSEIIEETWLYVQQRDWTKDKEKGGIEANV